MLRKISLKVKITLLVSLLVALGVGFVINLGLSKIQYVMEATLGAQAQTAALAVADHVHPAWLKGLPSAQHGAMLQQPGQLDLIQRLTKDTTLNISEIHVVRYLDGRNAEHVYNSLDPSHPFYIAPGTQETLLDSPVYFSRDPGYFPVANMERKEFYMAGWAPITSGPKRQEGLVMVLISANEIIRALNQMNLFLLAVAGAFTLVAAVASWKVAAGFEKVAVTDGLMGIVNHKHFKQRLEVECARASRYNLPLSLVMLDIDHFKKVNDSHGHAIGDLVLKNLGQWCLKTSRNTDLVARYGGEEIAIMLPHTALSGAQEFAERLRLKIANEWIRDNDEEVTLRVTVSVGVAQQERGMSAMDLIKRADAMLYESKRNGRNRVTCWTYDYASPDGLPAKTGEQQT